MNPGPRQWEHGTLTAGPPGKSLTLLFHSPWKNCLHMLPPLTSCSFFIPPSIPPKLASKLLNLMDTFKFLSYLTSQYHLNQLVFPLEILFSFENVLSGFPLLLWLLLFLFLWGFVFVCSFYCWCSSWCVFVGPSCLVSSPWFSFPLFFLPFFSLSLLK